MGDRVVVKLDSERADQRFPLGQWRTNKSESFITSEHESNIRAAFAGREPETGFRAPTPIYFTTIGV